MILESTALLGAYAASSGMLSLTMRRLSANIGARTRHAFAAMAPMSVVFAQKLGGADSVTLYWQDLAFGGTLFAAGLGASIFATGKRRLADATAA